MTTTTTNGLPEHKGEAVHKSKVKFTGVGTGFNALDDSGQPIFTDLDEVHYFVIKAKGAESPSVKRDGKGELFWLNRLGVETMAPIPRETAEQAIQNAARIEEDRKASVDGQLRLDEEAAAEAREELDETGTPEEIAAAAGQRAKQKP